MYAQLLIARLDREAEAAERERESRMRSDYMNPSLPVDHPPASSHRPVRTAILEFLDRIGSAFDWIVWSNPTLPLYGLSEMDAPSWRELKTVAKIDRARRGPLARSVLQAQAVVAPPLDQTLPAAEALSVLGPDCVGRAEQVVEPPSTVKRRVAMAGPPTSSGEVPSVGALAALTEAE